MPKGSGSHPAAWISARAAQLRQPRGEPQLAARCLPRLRPVAGVPISPGFLALTVTGEAAQSDSLGLRGRPLSATAAPGAPPAPQGSTRWRPAPAGPPCPAVPPAAAPSLGPPPSVNTVAARPRRPDAQVGACGAGRHREAAPSRVPTASASPRSADPEAAPSSRDAPRRRQRARRTKAQVSAAVPALLGTPARPRARRFRGHVLVRGAARARRTLS